MSASAVEALVPGKLLVLGEYAVLDPGAWALVLAVDRHVRVRIEPSDTLVLDCPDVGIEGLVGNLGRASPRWGKNLGVEGFRKLRFVHHAMTLALWVADRAHADIAPFRIRVESALGAGADKMGLGSSAAVVSGVAAAILAWTGLDPSTPSGRARLFKVAALAHFMAQEKRGSGADVAAAVHGGLIAYRNPGLGELMRSVDATGGLPGLVDRFWEGLRAEPLLWPAEHVFLAAGTGAGSSTRELIERFETLAPPHDLAFARLKTDLGRLAHDALARGTPEVLGAAMRVHQEALARFDAALGGAGVITPALERLLAIAAEHSVPAKVSGAGGGDSVIALIPRARSAELAQAWSSAGFATIEIDRPHEGARITRSS